MEYEKNDQKHIVYRPARLESYCSLFLDGITLRENCYRCPYAKTERIGDITIGDYWAFESVHPELKNNPAFEERRGISCVLVNSEKGRELCESIEKTLCLYDSEMNKVVMHN